MNEWLFTCVAGIKVRSSELFMNAGLAVRTTICDQTHLSFDDLFFNIKTIEMRFDLVCYSQSCCVIILRIVAEINVAGVKIKFWPGVQRDV